MPKRILLFTACCLLVSQTFADWVDDVAGSIEAKLNGQVVAFAALSSSYAVDIKGDLVNVSVKQVFENPYDQPLNARYLFPLNQDAAVHAMTMTVGNEVVSAEIQEIKQAKATFKAAKQAGKAATLLQQHRPNMFSQRIANLMPGLPITVEIQYSQIVPKVDGAYELVVPLVVGPRFQPAGAGVAPMEGAAPIETNSQPTLSLGEWVLEKLPSTPNTAGVHIPQHIVRERVSMEINLETPLPLQHVTSFTHPMSQEFTSSTQQTLRFADGEVLDNKDFVLRYQIAGDAVSAGLLSHWEPLEGGYFSMLIEPPENVISNQVIPREMVFLLDCSGSMGGVPMEASKAFMRHALANLRPTDTFRIIRFSDAATEFSTQPLPATSANIAKGIAYANSLYGSGGTHMRSGIEQALQGKPPQGSVRNVVFLTDGYIGNEVSVLRLVENLLGDARLYAFGVGAGVNRYLMSELGRVGRGFTRFFDPTKSTETVDAVARELSDRLQSPVLTDIEIDWGNLAVEQVVPARVPDLYAGDTVRVTGRYREASQGEVTIRAKASGHRAEIVQRVNFDETDTRPTIRRIWARNTLAELMHQFVSPQGRRPNEISHHQLQQAVTELGLKYELASRWTAFVAVSRKIVNTKPEQNLEGEVALPKVAGVTQQAYPSSTMTGYAAPEPGLLLGLLVALLTVVGLRRLAGKVASV